MPASSGHFENKGPSVIVITAVAVIVVLILAGLLFTLSQTKIYQASATLKISRTMPSVTVTGGGIASSTTSNFADQDAIVQAIESDRFVEKVAARLTGDIL